MYNKFEVVLYRFHMKKKNTLLIKGYFEEGCKKNNSLKIMLDQKELNVAIDEEINQGIALSSELGTSRAKYIYELQVELPGNWEKGQKIRVINCLNEKEKEEYKISVAKLVKNKNRIEKYVECEKVSEKGFVIKGWCIYQNKVDIIVKDEKKNILPVKIKEKKRVDVFNQYPECTEEDVYGFEIVYKGNVPKVVYVYLEEGNKSAKYGVTLKASVVKKGVNKVKRYKDKGMIYLKKYGIKDVFERVEMKLSRKNHEMYEYWRRLYVPTKKQLKEQSEQAFEIEPKISIVVPLYKTDQRFLKEMIDSVKGQSYSNWELCLSDGSGNPSPLKDILTKYENEDKRIKVIRNDFPLQISDNTNKALELVSGDWVAFMDHDDLLTPDAFYECVKAINQNEKKGDGFMVPIGVSARHIHLTQEHVEALFGPGYQLTKKKELMGGQFASNETVTIVGLKLRAIENVRILGPVRKASQVEVSATDAIKLGMNVPVRESGDITGSAPVAIVGPKGAVYLKEGCIVAMRHIHMSPKDAQAAGVKDGDIVSVKADNERGTIFNQVKIRVDDSFTLEMHIDTDEANAAKIATGNTVTIIK